MAYNPNELVVNGTPRAGAKPAAATHIHPVTFAAGSGTLAIGTPVAFNTSTGFWVVWASGGANGTGTIAGFVWPDAVTLDADEEVLGNIMFTGDIHYSAIVLPAGQTENNLKASLRTDCRTRGLIVQGLDQVR